ncbi:MAG: hypothetical protein ACI9OJ_000988 [Myxococcota bacterium]|jgi:hypothetical protein
MDPKPALSQQLDQVDTIPRLRANGPNCEVVGPCELSEERTGIHRAIRNQRHRGLATVHEGSGVQLALPNHLTRISNLTHSGLQIEFDGHWRKHNGERLLTDDA